MYNIMIQGTQVRIRRLLKEAEKMQNKQQQGKINIVTTDNSMASLGE